MNRVSATYPRSALGTRLQDGGSAPRRARTPALKYPGRDSNPHGREGQWLLRPSCLTNSTTRAGRDT
jgi:hypothetical protein